MQVRAGWSSGWPRWSLGHCFRHDSHGGFVLLAEGPPLLNAVELEHHGADSGVAASGAGEVVAVAAAGMVDAGLVWVGAADMFAGGDDAGAEWAQLAAVAHGRVPFGAGCELAGAGAVMAWPRTARTAGLPERGAAP